MEGELAHIKFIQKNLKKSLKDILNELDRKALDSISCYTIDNLLSKSQYVECNVLTELKPNDTLFKSFEIVSTHRLYVYDIFSVIAVIQFVRTNKGVIVYIRVRI